jgi:hypothetical protein
MIIKTLNSIIMRVSWHRPDEDITTTTTTTTKRSNKISNLFTIVLICMLVFDSLIDPNFYDIIGKQFANASGIMLFSIIVLTSVILSQFIFVNPIRQIVKDLGIAISYYYKTTYRIAIIAHYLLSAILVILVFQLILTSQYHVGLLILIVAISMVSASLVSGLFTYRFISWYKSNKRDIMILLFCIAFVFTVAEVALKAILVDGILVLSNKSMPQIKMPQRFSYIDLNQPSLGIFGSIYTSILGMIQIMPGILIWIASAILLNRYSQKMGRLTYWTLISIPLIINLAAIFPTILGIIFSHKFVFYQSNLFVFRVFFRFSAMGLGSLFGFVFINAARSFPGQRQQEKLGKSNNNNNNNSNSNNTIRDNLALIGYGIIMVTAALVTSVLHTPYPPFGSVALSFLAISSYMSGLGFYSLAISISHDMKLRKLIKNLTIQESKLLGNIGTAQMEQEIQQRVLKVAKEQQQSLKQEMDVKSSISEDQIKDYMDQVMRETSSLSKDKKRE